MIQPDADKLGEEPKVLNAGQLPIERQVRRDVSHQRCTRAFIVG